jgi:hypothetical protein
VRPSLAFPFLVFVLIQRPDTISRAAAPSAPPTYEREIRPLLARRCTGCHNAGKKKVFDVSGGLALDSYDAIRAGTGRHRVVVAGKASESELARRINDPDEDRRMPLYEDPLTSAEQDLLRRWIDAGLPRGKVPVQGSTEMAKPPDKVPASPSAKPRGPIRWRRSVDVAIPLELKIPDGALGLKKGGALRITARIGPLPPVSSLSIRGDGALLAAGTYGQVVLWDLVEVRPISLIGGLPGPIHALEFSRDGKRLAIGSGSPAKSGVVQVHAVPGGELLHRFEGHDDVVFGLAFRPDGGRIASASFDQTVRIWDLAEGKPSGVFHGHSDFVEAIAYAKDGRSILSAGKDRTIKRIDATTLKELRTYSGHNDDVLSLALHPDGIGFVSAGNEPQLRWWGLDADKPTRTRGGHGGPVHQLAFSRNGRRLISASGDGSARIWDGETGSPLRTLKGTSEWQYSAAISDDGRIAAAGGWDGLIHLWNVETGKLQGTLIQIPIVGDESSTRAPVDWLAIAPEGYQTGSSEAIDLVRGRVGDETIREADLRAACVDPGLTSRAIRGETVPPIKIGASAK